MILYVFYRQKWREMDQDSRESAATTIIHRKTQGNENGKNQNTETANEYFRDFHTSHAECPLLIYNGTGGEEEIVYIRSSMEEEPQGL